MSYLDPSGSPVDPGGALTHNSLAHSLKEGQVARSIAEIPLSDKSNYPSLVALGGLDSDVAEAAALAHDLGHPPFGHIGETVLDAFARDELELDEGFEGNAQTFRIITRLDSTSPSYPGADLTAATRCAVLKYPWRRVPRESENSAHRARLETEPSYELRWKKFGYYAGEQSDFDEARSIPASRKNSSRSKPPSWALLMTSRTGSMISRTFILRGCCRSLRSSTS